MDDWPFPGDPQLVVKVGDTWPPLRLNDGFAMMDLTGCRASYVFAPDSKRAKRREGSLRISDPERGAVEIPRIRTPGWVYVLVHFANGDVASLRPYRVEA